jgi:hypothetical protein
MKTWVRIYLSATGALLLAAGLLSFLNAAEGGPILVLPDPLLGVPMIYGVLLAGIIEIAAGLFCLLGTRSGAQSALVAWLLAIWGVYRLGAFWQGCSMRCTCLGSVADPLHVHGAATAWFCEIAPLCMLAGACAILLQAWQSKTPNPAAALTKLACSHCGGRVQFGHEWTGKTIDCPHCHQSITLRAAAL